MPTITSAPLSTGWKTEVMAGAEAARGGVTRGKREETWLSNEVKEAWISSTTDSPSQPRTAMLREEEYTVLETPLFWPLVE